MTSPNRRNVILGASGLLVGCASRKLNGGIESNSSAWGDFWARKDTSRKVAIVGGGPAGITTAFRLWEKGYRNITIFERNAALGGKVYSHFRNDKPNEMGAVYATGEYKTVMEIARKVKAELREDTKPLIFVDEKNKQMTFANFLTNNFSKRDLAVAYERFAANLVFHKGIFEQGNYAAKPELFVPFEEFATKANIRPIAELFRSTMVGCGYGYYEEVPALYLLKLLKTWYLNSLRAAASPVYHDPVLYKFPMGFQNFWQLVAKSSLADIRLNAEVSGIERKQAPSPGESPVTIKMKSGESLQFDAVIIAAPFPVMKDVLDVDDEERDLLSKVKTYRYFATLFEGQGMNDGNTLFLHGKSKREQLKRTIIFGNFSYEPNIWTSYQLTDWDTSTSRLDTLELKDIIKTDAIEQKGTVKEFILQKEWNYFPYVDSEALAQQFFPRMERLQGQRACFYTGGVMSFESTEFAAEHATRLVAKHF